MMERPALNANKKLLKFNLATHDDSVLVELRACRLTGLLGPVMMTFLGSQRI